VLSVYFCELTVLSKTHLQEELKEKPKAYSIRVSMFTALTNTSNCLGAPSTYFWKGQGFANLLVVQYSKEESLIDSSSTKVSSN
jgi:hypothetical protein